MCGESGTAMACRNLWARYGTGPWIVKGVDLTIERGDRVAIVGANGAGKSTLLHALGGIVPVERGEVMPPRETASVGLVLQDPDDQLFGATVAEDVALGLIDRGVPCAEIDERVAAALDALGLTALAASPLYELSLGQRKRAAIAGILVTTPQVVLLDEPTAGLDPLGVDELLALLEQLRAHGAAIVLTTHDTRLAAEWSDRVFVLHEGVVLAHGRPAEVLTDPEVLRQARLRRLPAWPRPTHVVA